MGFYKGQPKGTPTFISVNVLSDKTQKVAVRYSNQNLAVHRVIVSREDCDNKVVGLSPRNDDTKNPWVVTHKGTGFAAARFNSLASAVRVAMKADSLNWASTAEEIKSNKELVETFIAMVNSERGILCK